MLFYFYVVALHLTTVKSGVPHSKINYTFMVFDFRSHYNGKCLHIESPYDTEKLSSTNKFFLYEVFSFTLVFAVSTCRLYLFKR
jgi:hypothetical protein